MNAKGDADTEAGTPAGPPRLSPHEEGSKGVPRRPRLAPGRCLLDGTPGARCAPLSVEV